MLIWVQYPPHFQTYLLPLTTSSFITLLANSSSEVPTLVESEEDNANVDSSKNDIALAQKAEPNKYIAIGIYIYDMCV